MARQLGMEGYCLAYVATLTDIDAITSKKQASIKKLNTILTLSVCVVCVSVSVMQNVTHKK